VFRLSGGARGLLSNPPDDVDFTHAAMLLV
jgi:hypothetical protein